MPGENATSLFWAELLWKEYNYRHNLYWKSLYLWGGAAVTVFIAPFIKPDLKVLQFAIFIFPVIGLSISLVGAWHLAAESERLAVVMRRYNELRGEYKPPWPYDGKRTWYQQAVTASIGKAVTLLFCIGLSVFALVDTLFLLILLCPEKWIIPFIIGLSLVLVTGLGFYFIVYSQMKKHNRAIDPKDVDS